MRSLMTLAFACNIVLIILIQFALRASSSYAYDRNATKKALGTLIPRPRNVRDYDPKRISYLQINGSHFSIDISSNIINCEIVVKAVNRYAKLYLFEDIREGGRDDLSGDRLKVGDMVRLTVSPVGEFLCESRPHENMLEEYGLDLKAKEPKLSSRTSWGILRGLETFSQLIFYIMEKSEDKVFGVPALVIDDAPRFSYRGFMLDTSRHFISVSTIKTTLDAMAASKLNVFHWHLIDDQSFPYESKAFPELSKKSAYRPTMVYRPQDVQEVIEYATERGIRVIPELDSPGHAYSMRHLKGLLTSCYDTNTKMPNGDVGPVNPTRVESISMISKLIKEFSGVFPDKYFHIGGDEVDYQCWMSNPLINDWMARRNISYDYKELFNMYIRKVYDLTTHFNRTLMAWQEVFDNNVDLPKDSIFQVWKYRGDRLAYEAVMRRIVTAGYKAILSSCWYLNYIDYGQDWNAFYQCDPTSGLPDTEEARRLVLGGEVCMWTEFVDDTNVISRTWPRAAAAAERLWSSTGKWSWSEFMPRLEQFRCRLLARKIAAEPVNGPGYC